MQGRLRSGCRAAVDAGKGLRVSQEGLLPQEAKGYVVSQRCLWGPARRTQNTFTKVMCVSFGINDVTHLLECYIPHGVLQHTAAYCLPMESQRT